MVLVAANQDTVFGRLAAVMGRPELADGPALRDARRARCSNMDELDELIAEWTARSSAGELLEQLHDGGVPAGRIYPRRDMFADPHFAAREAIVRLAHPTSGSSPCRTRPPSSPRPPAAVRQSGPAWASTTKRSTRACWGWVTTRCRRCSSAGVI